MNGFFKQIKQITQGAVIFISETEVQLNPVPNVVKVIEAPFEAILLWSQDNYHHMEGCLAMHLLLMMHSYSKMSNHGIIVGPAGKTTPLAFCQVAAFLSDLSKPLAAKKSERSSGKYFSGVPIKLTDQHDIFSRNIIIEMLVKKEKNILSKQVWTCISEWVGEHMNMHGVIKFKKIKPTQTFDTYFVGEKGDTNGRLNATECFFKKIHLPWLPPQWSKILSCPLLQFQDYKIPPEDSLILSSLEKYLIKK